MSKPSGGTRKKTPSASSVPSTSASTPPAVATTTSGKKRPASQVSSAKGIGNVSKVTHAEWVLDHEPLDGFTEQDDEGFVVLPCGDFAELLSDDQSQPYRPFLRVVPSWIAAVGGGTGGISGNGSGNSSSNSTPSMAASASASRPTHIKTETIVELESWSSEGVLVSRDGRSATILCPWVDEDQCDEEGRTFATQRIGDLEIRDQWKSKTNECREATIVCDRFFQGLGHGHGQGLGQGQGQSQGSRDEAMRHLFPLPVVVAQKGMASLQCTSGIPAGARWDHIEDLLRHAKRVSTAYWKAVQTLVHICLYTWLESVLPDLEEIDKLGLTVPYPKGIVIGFEDLLNPTQYLLTLARAVRKSCGLVTRNAEEKEGCLRFDQRTPCYLSPKVGFACTRVLVNPGPREGYEGRTLPDKSCPLYELLFLREVLSGPRIYLKHRPAACLLRPTETPLPSLLSAFLDAKLGIHESSVQSYAPLEEPETEVRNRHSPRSFYVCCKPGTPTARSMEHRSSQAQSHVHMDPNAPGVAYTKALRSPPRGIQGYDWWPVIGCEPWLALAGSATATAMDRDTYDEEEDDTPAAAATRPPLRPFICESRSQSDPRLVFLHREERDTPLRFYCIVYPTGGVREEDRRQKVDPWAYHRPTEERVPESEMAWPLDGSAGPLVLRSDAASLLSPPRQPASQSSTPFSALTPF